MNSNNDLMDRNWKPSPLDDFETFMNAKKNQYNLTHKETFNTVHVTNWAHEYVKQLTMENDKAREWTLGYAESLMIGIKDGPSISISEAEQGIRVREVLANESTPKARELWVIKNKYGYFVSEQFVDQNDYTEETKVLHMREVLAHESTPEPIRAESVEAAHEFSVQCPCCGDEPTYAVNEATLQAWNRDGKPVSLSSGDETWKPAKTQRQPTIEYCESLKKRIAELEGEVARLKSISQT